MLDGRVVLITGDRSGVAEHLGAFGALVAAVPEPFATRAEVAAAFREVARTNGPIDVVVHAYVPAAALSAQLLADTTGADWDARGEELLRAALFVVQAAYAELQERGGRIVLLTPTAGLEGASGFTPLATATEGMRALARSAARQWGERGITINCLAPPVSFFGADVTDPIDPPALGRGPTSHDVAHAIAMLAGEHARFVTGATIPVDGGVVMLP